MSVTSTSTIAPPVDTVFQLQLLRNAKVRAPYFLGSVTSEQPVRKGSFQATWRRINNLTPTTSALSEISSETPPYGRTGEALTTTEVTATVAKYGQVLFLTEEVDLGNFTGQMPKLIEVLGISAGRSLNRLQRNILEDNATAIRQAGANADTDVTETISTILIRQAVNAIGRLSATNFTAETQGDPDFNTTPTRPAYWGLCHVDVEEDLRDLNEFIAVEKYSGQTATVMGEIGAVAGVRWISSEDASIDTDGGGAHTPGSVRSTSDAVADVYHNMVFGMDYHGSLGFGFEHTQSIYKAGDNLPSIQMIRRVSGPQTVSDPLDEAGTASFKAWHSGAILNPDWGRRIVTAARVLN